METAAQEPSQTKPEARNPGAMRAPGSPDMHAPALPAIDLTSASWRSMSHWTLVAIAFHLLLIAAAFVFYQAPPKTPEVFNVSLLPMAPPAPEAPAPTPAPKPQPVVKQQAKPVPVPKIAPVDSKTAISREQPAPAPTTHEVQSTAPASGADKPNQTVAESKPQFDAAYLNNPRPAYPSMSRRLGEEGRVEVEVQVQPDGSAGKVSLKRSSGYPRLDDAALEAIKRWKFVPAKRNGEAVAASVIVPMPFILEK
ncbi:MAG: energy transducer TonB [Rhodocyclaceae bacterium]|nr:energy transducer TonB [Rhodocyclaceae bacterium]